MGVPARGAPTDGGYVPFTGNETTRVTSWNTHTDSSQLFLQSTDHTAPLRTLFDSKWTNDISPELCTDLVTQIKAQDGSYQHDNQPCTMEPASKASFYAKQLGTNLIGLRYFVPGHDDVLYSYNHGLIIGAENIDVSFDVTVDVVLRFAPGVNKLADPSAPISVQSARLSLSNAWVRATACSAQCTEFERDIDGVVQDIRDRVDVSAQNTAVQQEVLNQYGRLSADVNTTDVSSSGRDLTATVAYDPMPAFDPRVGVASQQSTVTIFGRTGTAVNIFGVGNDGALWSQWQAFGTRTHWHTYGAPAGTKLLEPASATAAPSPTRPGVVIGRDGLPHVFVTAANGHLYEISGSSWIDHGAPAATTVVGGPSATSVNGLTFVVARGANGNVELRYETAPGTWTWKDLGNPGSALTLDPAIASIGGNAAVLVTRADGHVLTREKFGPGFAVWRDLAALASPAVSAPSVTVYNGAFAVFVTGADQNVDEITFAPFSTASAGEWQRPALLPQLPAVASAPSATTPPGNAPIVFVGDTNGNLDEFATSPNPRIGFIAVTDGALLGMSMSAPAAFPGTTVDTGFGAFAVGGDGHVGETSARFTAPDLIDHNTLSRVRTQAYGVAGRFHGWGVMAEEGMSATASVSPLAGTTIDAFRVNSTIGGSVACDAYMLGAGWLPEVRDGQPCGTPRSGQISGIRLQRVDPIPGDPFIHVLYRCYYADPNPTSISDPPPNAPPGDWSPWLSDGTVCGSPNLDEPIQAVQVQFSDTATPSVSYRTVATGSSDWPAWTTDNNVAGHLGQSISGIEAHSEVGGQLVCVAYVQNNFTNPISFGATLGIDGSLCGGTKDGDGLTGFALGLSGAPNGEHVTYRAYLHTSGWTSWASDGAPVGSVAPILTPDYVEQVQIAFTHS
jgi:hypothetical protein